MAAESAIPEVAGSRARHPDAPAGTLQTVLHSQAAERAFQAAEEPAARGQAAASALDWLAAPTTHPEEMKAAYEVRFGPLRLSGGARMTPAAVIAAGVCTGIILLGVAVVIRAGRR
ncbi:hypothetical protein EV667_0247 [Ancylobacter aquaticus]|uniref:Uncharacterized protein n=1 Tax=Ancylobacter aquaticus TaxID=100 RepID=A0A4R1IAX0_ANCAQ|nr:hypothetical protein [Ancylobacter aquaticus]TCK30159.1 hypothetical protein EV667_0247 [Ancylobacter aquaticus]